MMNNKGVFIIEELSDLAIDNHKSPFSAKVREIWLQYSTENPILNNGQMVCLKYPNNVKDKIFDYFQKILTEFIEDENRLNECFEIKNKYIMHIDNVNNTNKYVRTIFDVIISMDRVNKYIWNISKLLVDNIESYESYIAWQRKTINIPENVRAEWNLIYNIRNTIEHPENLTTTFFKRRGENSEIPQIIYKEKEYDLFELGMESLQCVYIFLETIIGASFLYSKYIVVFTDETRTKLFKN